MVFMDVSRNCRVCRTLSWAKKAKSKSVKSQKAIVNEDVFPAEAMKACGSIAPRAAAFPTHSMIIFPTVLLLNMFAGMGILLDDVIEILTSV